MILTKALTKSYGKKKVVDKIEIKVPKRSIYCLVGPNGAGKTTILDIISTLKHPTSGTAIIGGFDLKTDAKAIRKIIGVMPQDSGFDFSQTPYEQMRFYAELSGLNTKDAKAEATRVLKVVDLPKTGKISVLSNGMRRLLGLAQAMLNKPELLILDEPFEGLDPLTTTKMKRILPKLKTTIIFSSHNMPQIEEVATHIGLLDQGEMKIQCSIHKIIDKKDRMELTFLRKNEKVRKALENLKSVQNVTVDNKKLIIKTRGDSMKLLPTVLNVIIRNGGRLHMIRKGVSLEREYVDITDSQD